jgi:hypothetical protein
MGKITKQQCYFHEIELSAVQMIKDKKLKCINVSYNNIPLGIGIVVGRQLQHLPGSGLTLGPLITLLRVSVSQVGWYLR